MSQEEDKEFDSLIKSVVRAVNARGKCAMLAAVIAALPAEDIDQIADLCMCAACKRGRMH